MKFKKFAKMLVDRRPDIERKHGIPMTRRELLAQGYIAGSSFALMPSLAALVSEKALGQSDQCNTGGKAASTHIPVLIIDGAGGWNIPGRNIIVGGQGGQDDFLPNESYSSIGLLPEVAPGVVAPMNNFGLLMAPANISGFYAGLNAATADATAANIDGAYFAVRSQNDTGNNQHNPARWLVKAGAGGEVVDLIGTEDTDFGGNSLGPTESLSAADRPIRVTDPNSAIGLVLPGVLASLSNNNSAFVQKVFKVVTNMSERQLKKFNSMPARAQAQILCAYSGAEFQASSFDSATLDPLIDPIISGIFDFNDGTQARTGSLAKLALDGFVGVGVQRIGGCDYHNNAIQSVFNKDEQIGRAAGQFLEAAAQKGKSAHVIIYTDGGTGAGGSNLDAANFPGFNGPTSDNGQRAGMFSLTYQAGANGRPVMNTRQVGHYGANGAIASSDAISDSVVGGAEAMVANYIALHAPAGEDPAKYIEDELNRVVGRNSFGDDLMRYIAYQRLK